MKNWKPILLVLALVMILGGIFTIYAATARTAAEKENYLHYIVKVVLDSEADLPANQQVIRTLLENNKIGYEEEVSRVYVPEVSDGSKCFLNYRLLDQDSRDEESALATAEKIREGLGGGSSPSVVVLVGPSEVLLEQVK